MQSVGRRYVRYVNETYGRTGTSWEGRFKSAVSRDEYLIACSRYIELNPVRAGLVTHLSVPGIGRVGSLAGCGLLVRRTGSDHEGETRQISRVDRNAKDEGEWDGIRHATQRGRLIGRETFQKQVEAMTGRRLVGEARGRPKKMAGMSIEKVL